MASHYTFVNYDLLVFGAIFHDLGKIYELEINNDLIQYTQKGRLLGHMQLACELIDKKAARILGFPEDLKDILKQLKDQGKILFINSHILMEMEQLCDEIAILNRGKLLFAGSVTSVLEKEKSLDDFFYKTVNGGRV